MIRKTALLGASTLAGRELIERLRATHVSLGELALVEPGSENAVISAIADELLVSTPRVAEALDGANLVLNCARLSDADAALVVAAGVDRLTIDLAGVLAARAFDARRIGPGDVSHGIHASAAGASLLTAALARSARAAGAKGPLVATVLEAASEIGQEALDELYGQALAMLNFSEMPKAVFGHQAVHDVVSPGLRGAEREEQLRREVAELLGEAPPALLLVRPGTFHGVGVALHAPVDPEAWRAAMASEPRLRHVAEDEAASPVAAVQGEQALVGRLESDGVGGAWAWAAADTLTQGAVGNVVELLASREKRPHGH